MILRCFRRKIKLTRFDLNTLSSGKRYELLKLRLSNDCSLSVLSLFIKYENFSGNGQSVPKVGKTKMPLVSEFSKVGDASHESHKVVAYTLLMFTL